MFTARCLHCSIVVVYVATSSHDILTLKLCDKNGAGATAAEIFKPEIKVNDKLACFRTESRYGLEGAIQKTEAGSVTDGIAGILHGAPVTVCV